MVKSFQTVEPIPPVHYLENMKELANRQMLPSSRREIPFKVIDIQQDTSPEKHETLAHLLRSRSTQNQPAFTLIDYRGKEASTMTWQKLSARAERIASLLREKLQTGDRVGLYYKPSEILDFAVSLLGCFLAGVVAVPLLEQVVETWFVLRVTGIRLVLTTDNQLKALAKELKSQVLDFPKDVDWLATQDMGLLYTHQIKSGHYSAIRPTHLAYIEFTKSINGELKGCTVSHKTVIHTCHALTASLTDTIIMDDGSMLPNWNAQRADTLLTYIDPRHQLGLTISVLNSIYNGTHTLFTDSRVIQTPAVWIHLVSKYKVTLAFGNYPGMETMTKQAMQSSKEIQNFNKRVPPDLSSLRLLLIDSLIVKLDTFISDRLLAPFGQDQDIVTPIASLPEYAGLILGFRDFLGPCRLESTWATGQSRDHWECTLDAVELRCGKVVLSDEGYRVGSHGFPIVGSSVVIVDPRTHLVCPTNQMGEIWISTEGAPDGFWGIPNDAYFSALPQWITETPMERPCVRTGILGTLIGGRLVLFGPYEDCIRQQQLSEPLGVEEIHFGHDLVSTLSKQCKIDTCTLFSVYINQQYLPVLALETTTEEKARVVDQATHTLFNHHGLRVFATIVVQRGYLPRQVRDGHASIHSLQTKHRFLSGQLPVEYLKIDTDRTVFSDASGDPNLWQSTAYDRALTQGLISPRARPQHSGIEMIQTSIDDRSRYDLSRFTNMVDIILWRTSLYPDENAFVTVSGNSTKPLSWKRINGQIAALAHYLCKKKVETGEKVLLILPFGVDLVRSIYACLVLGVVPVICSQESIVLSTLQDLSITTVLAHSGSEDVLRTVRHKIRLVYVEKTPKYNRLLGPESGYSVRSEWTSDKSRPAMILSHPSVNTYKQEYIVYGHDTILAQCRTQKLTCQLRYQRPLVVAGLGGLEGLGLLHAVFCGVYVGCATLLMSASEFKENTVGYFELISRNKCSTVCLNYPLLDQAINRIPPSRQKQISLENTQNIMLTVPSRTKPRFYEKITRFLSLSGLERATINTVYSHPWNPMITTRSYMLIEPIQLIADFEWLRQGIIRPISPNEDTYGVLLHDSGIVPTNTMVAIVNPETRALCHTHRMGEIWVSSDANAKKMTGGFEATVQGADPRIKYMRTGDIGFLWNVQRLTASGPVEEGQCLYVLGHLSEVLFSNGLIHFAVDVEETVETCHPSIWSEGCYIFQVETEIVVVVAVRSNELALSTIPLVVSAILERHALLIDTIVIVSKDQLPKKHNGEKRRKLILSMYMKKELSAIHVSRIRNQHQPIHLPQWDRVQDDTASVISFGQNSNYDPDSTSVYKPYVSTSIRSRRSNGAESVV